MRLCDFCRARNGNPLDKPQFFIVADFIYTRHEMTKKYAVAIGLTTSMVFLLTAMAIYPGGTYTDKNAIGFNWTKNYISNLFETTALNGMENPSRIWAYLGVLIYSITCAVFFVNMSQKIPERNSANIIKYTGILTLPCTLLVVTPLHNLMLTISTFLFWTCITWISAFVFQTKLHFLKVYCLLCLLIFYYAVYIHATNNWDVLPTIQKVNSLSSILLILALEYFTQKADFEKSSREIKKQI